VSTRRIIVHRLLQPLTAVLAGSGVFIGLGAYSYYSGMAQLEMQRKAILQSKSIFGMASRRAGITGISLTFVGMGLWRAIK
jgi:hypothetical protein